MRNTVSKGIRQLKAEQKTYLAPDPAAASLAAHSAFVEGGGGGGSGAENCSATRLAYRLRISCDSTCTYEELQEATIAAKHGGQHRH